MSIDPQVEVSGGILEGYVCVNEEDPKQSYFCFQGIPYAKPPLGPLRFKAPQPADSWKGVREVKKDGNPCFAKNLLNPKETLGSEDCLYLNIYTPNLPEKQGNSFSYNLKPVMVYIHGGSFTGGSNSKSFYNPDYLIRDDVVFVSINYRLGFLGFLHMNDPKLGVPGNAGLKDQVLALRWVKNNIKNFNGDPENITIFGESAGAASVHLLVLSPMATGLFHKAIIQSGCAIDPWTECDNVTPRIAQALNMEYDEPKLLKKLQDMTVEELHAMQESFPDPWDVSIKRMVGYVIENCNQEEEAFLTKHPLELLQKGQYNDVPLIIGFNSREGMLVHATDKKTFKELTPDIENIVPHYFNLQKGSALSKKVAQKIMEYYYSNQDPDEVDVDILYKLWSDNLFIRDIYRSVTNHAETSSSDIYVYEMTIETSLNLFKQISGITSPGVAHADDIFYLFKTIMNGKIEPNSPEDKGVRIFSRLWTNFAKYGNPNSPREDPLLMVQWKKFTTNAKNYLEIGQELKARTEPLKDRMKFWQDLYTHRNDTNFLE